MSSFFSKHNFIFEGEFRGYGIGLEFFAALDRVHELCHLLFDAFLGAAALAGWYSSSLGVSRQVDVHSLLISRKSSSLVDNTRHNETHHDEPRHKEARHNGPRHTSETASRNPCEAP